MLKIENLKKKYKNFTLDCSLQVKKGSITALVGQNGAGKSTTFKSVLGLITPDSGNITVFGKDIKKLTERDRESLGVVLSDSGFSGYLTVRDIIPVLRSLYREFDEKLFTEKITDFGLPKDKKIKDFSTGMKAKLKVITAISHNAKLLVLDEPTSGLDVIARDELLLLLREFMEEDEDRAILISSHISSDIETLCDDIYMIKDGRIVLFEDTDRILSDYGIIKCGITEYEKLDKSYILYTQKEPFGICCLTNERRFYTENYPSYAVERGTLDSVITMIIKGEKT